MADGAPFITADTDTAEAAGADSRIGPAFLAPGLGFGGSCPPKNIRAFAARAEEIGRGEPVAFLRQVDEIDTRQRLRTIGLAERFACGSLADRDVTVPVTAFEPGSNDVRDSPALAVAEAVRRRGARVRVHDPAALATVVCSPAVVDARNTLGTRAGRSAATAECSGPSAARLSGRKISCV
ncbi:UDP binding domain-containing protein [Streptomyces triticiradicis]|uniref:UDP binding domain-containing protein n=1 Tax=Streptomyces triticiradicis TaxID=2651189 RepID=UPI001CEDDA47|nr:UDP binding domain-containing protein [Streptomyces triticiradicis]